MGFNICVIDIQQTSKYLHSQKLISEPNFVNVNGLNVRLL